MRVASGLLSLLQYRVENYLKIKPTMNYLCQARYLLASLPLASLAFSHSLSAATFAVTNLNDSGAGTLRVAISNANASAGLDTITFAINTNTPGVKTITLASALPPLTEPAVLDGTTQPGYTNAPLIEINGNFLSSVHGLVIAGGGSTVRALSIRNCGSSSSAATRASGILISTNGGNVVAGCYLGLTTNGVSALQNTADGITIDNSPDNVIGGTNAADRNVIGGNSRNGIQIFGLGSTNNRIMGNLIGLSVPGTNALGNFNAGIFLTNVTGNVIGGTNAGARNVIARNSSFNVLVQNSSGVVIVGNYVGLKPDGTTLTTNLDSVTGISFNNSSNNIVGGLVSAARNIIGNLQNGVSIFGSNSVGNVVVGNFIGTGPSGTNTVPNSFGVFIGSGAQSNRVGGTVAGSRNIISGNRSSGVNLSSSNNLVQGNYIGVDITGQRPPLPLPASGSGINIQASGNVIGGATPAARNLISGNRSDGIQVGSFSAVLHSIVIQGNYIGTDAGGTLAVSNRNNGIVVFLNTTNCLIGGTNTGEGNVISGNGDNGIWLGAQAPVSGVRVLGNRIGFTADLTPPPSAANFARPRSKPVALPNAPFLNQRLNGQHGVRGEHMDNCVLGVPGAPNLISCGNAGDCITIIDGTGNDFVNNGFANFGPFLTIDNFFGTQNNLDAPLINRVFSGAGHTVVSGTCFGQPNSTVTVHLMSGLRGSSVQFNTGAKVTVFLDSEGNGFFTFDLPYESPLSGFSAFAQNAGLSTSELRDPFAAEGSPGTARVAVGSPSALGGIALDGKTTFPVPLTVVGPANASAVKENVSFNPGSSGLFSSTSPFITTPNGIQISLGDLVPGDNAGPTISCITPPDILGNGFLKLLAHDASNPVGFADPPLAVNPNFPDQIFEPLTDAGSFDGIGGANDVVTIDGVTGNAFVALNPAGPSASIVTLPLGSYCRQHNMRATSLTTFRGPGGVNHIAATIVTWPWVPVPEGELVVFANSGDGTFGTPMRIFPASPDATGLVNGDFNGDSFDDLTYVDPRTGSVALTLNDGGNSFLTPSVRETGGFAPASVVIGDMNADEILDVAVLNQGDGQQNNPSIVSVLLGLGNGTLAAPGQLLQVPNFALSMVGGLEHSAGSIPSRKAVDFNADGFPDFVLTSTRGGLNAAGQSAPSVTVILNRPDAPGSFVVAPPISVEDAFFPSGGSRVAANDLDGDGRTDIVVVEQGSGYATILYNNGAPGYFVPTFGQSTLPIGGANCAVAVSDFDGDGEPDIVVASSAQVGFQVTSSFMLGGNLVQGDTINVLQPVIAANNPVMGPLLVDRGFGVVDSPSGFVTTVEFSPGLPSFSPQPNVATIGNRSYFPLGNGGGIPNRFFRATSQPPVP